MISKRGEIEISRRKVLIVSRCAWTLVTFRSGLIRFLQEQDVEVHVAGWGGDGYAKNLKQMGVIFHDLPVSMSSISVLRDLRLVRAMMRLYRTVDPDVIHHFTIKPVIYGSIAAQLTGKANIVNTITGLGYAFTNASWLLSKIVRTMYRTALGRSSTVFFQNPDDRELFERLKIVRKDTTEVVPGSGVDVEYFHPNFHNPAESGDVKILFVGRLLKDKGIHEFISAAGKLHKNGDRLRFYALGDFDERNPSCISKSTLDDATAAGIVDWLGKTDDVRNYLTTADIVVLPSYREGVPRSLLEAAAMGIPLVATDVPGCRRVVEHGYNGLLVPPNDADSLAVAIDELANNVELRDQMGRAGREKVVAEFDEAIVLQKTWRAYQQFFQ